MHGEHTYTRCLFSLPTSILYVIYWDRRRLVQKKTNMRSKHLFHFKFAHLGHQRYYDS